MIPLYFGKKFTTTAVGRRVERVVCEKCRKEFWYELVRLGVGTGNAPYSIGEKSAAKRALIEARDIAERRIAGEAELIPCPNCRWVNQDLIDRYRQSRFQLGVLRIIGLMLSAVCVSSVVAAIAMADRNGVLPVYFWAVPALALLTPIPVVIIRRRLRSNIDPNVLGDKPFSPLPGTPPALTQTLDSITGRPFYKPILRAPDDRFASWIVVRPGQLVFPDKCCRCLGRPSTHYTHMVKLTEESGDGINIPLCRSCYWKLRFQWLFWVPVVLAGAIGIGYGVAAMSSKPDVGVVLGIIAGIVVGLIGLFTVPNMLVLPYRIGVIDEHRGIVKFKVKYEQYHAMIAQRVREQEGFCDAPRAGFPGD